MCEMIRCVDTGGCRYRGFSVNGHGVINLAVYEVAGFHRMFPSSFHWH
jgi:hypothetical protein